MPNATRQLDDEQWMTLQSALRSTVARYVPDWAEPPQHDPGITLVELFAFLGESLIDRAPALSERARSRLAAVIVELELLRSGNPSLRLPGDDSSGTEQFAGVKRVHYFAGQSLGEKDFRDEQRYLNDKRHLHNRLLHGTGVVTGLGVSVSSSSPAVVTVRPGLALDSLGREVQVTKAIDVTVTEDVSPQCVMVDYVERNVDFTLAPGGDAEPTRIEEGARVRLVGPSAPADGVGIGRIVKRASGWELDHSFEPRRSR